jgi:hypothetical protein
MKRVLGFLGFLMMSVCSWSETQATNVVTDRFAVSLPEGFQAQKPQVAEGRTQWTYLRERVIGHSDCRLRVTVLEGSKTIPADRTGLQVALALLAGYTSQQTKSLVDLRFGSVSRVVLHDRTWWCVPWTGRNRGVPIAGLSYISTAFDAEYFLIFESLSSEDGSKVSTEILSSFEPKRLAKRTPEPSRSARGSS